MTTATTTAAMKSILNEMVNEDNATKEQRHKVIRLLKENNIKGEITLEKMNQFLAYYNLSDLILIMSNRVKKHEIINSIN